MLTIFEEVRMIKGAVNVVVPMEIPRGRIADLLCSGMEGYIGHWGKVTSYVDPPEEADLFSGMPSWKSEVYPHIHYPMCEAGGGVFFEDASGEGFPPGRELPLLNYAAICRGLQIMATKYPRHFGDFIAENDDAVTGDVFIQCCLFGEVVFA